MPSVTRSRRSSNRREVEQDILTAVEQLLGQGLSYTEIPVQQIIEKAGVARSTFYVLFPDKTALLMRMSESVMEEIYADGKEFFLVPASDGPPALARRLQRFFRLWKGRPVLRALLEVAAYDPIVSDAWRSLIGRVIEDVTPLLEEEKQAGHLPADLDVPLTLELISHMLYGAMSHHALRDEMDEQYLLYGLARLAWLGLCAEVPQSSRDSGVPRPSAVSAVPNGRPRRRSNSP
jgi:AcrR family transcriptional regulator